MPITTSLKTGRYSEMTHLETIYVGTQEADNQDSLYGKCYDKKMAL